MWKENKYRSNQHISHYWEGLVERTFTHFYHVGSTENLRNTMEEALLIKPGYEATPIITSKPARTIQLSFPLGEQVE
jgi:DNA adenine methylase